MTCLLLALSLALLCGAQGAFLPQHVEDLDVQKVAGTWHSVAMAASDIALLGSEGAPLRMHIKELRPTPQGDLDIILNQREDSRCAERKVLAQKTQLPSEFSINYQGQDKVHVLSTDYENSLLLCMENSAAPGQRVACQYLARTPKVDEGVMEQFNEAMKLLSVRIWMRFTATQAQESCHI